MEKERIFDKLSLVIIIISIALIGFSFIAPVIFVQESIFGIDFNKTGPIGDTVGGLMNPFIALAGVSLTFLAFYIQLIANRQQRISFRTELDEQKEQFKKNQFENQFYEMIRLHKENVSEISITVKTSYYSGREEVKSEYQIVGREVFNLFLNEIKILYKVAERVFSEGNQDFWLNKAYHMFFQGIDYDIKKQSAEDRFRVFIDELIEIREKNSVNQTSFNNVIYKYKIKPEWYNYKLFSGHSSLLAHYFRHLFITVKFVANQDESLISYSEKRKYLRILRAQLSNQEQAMLFYNWKSGFGATWEDATNHFLTDFRMIHNLYNDLIIEDYDLSEIFRLSEKPYYKTEPNRENDTLFEFQDW